MLKIIGDNVKLKIIDRIVGIFFAVITIIIIVFFFLNRRFFEWAFIRHHNILSWYIRPLFIIPIILGALKKSYAIIFVTIFCLFTSMFWFPEPKKVNESVIKFLDFEKNYLTNGWTVDKIFVLLAILLFFIFLLYTTWNRNWKYLLFTTVFSAILKVIHSIIFGGKSGLSIVKPAFLGAIICVLVVWFVFKKRRNK